MNKREYILKLLTALLPSWPLAEWLLALMEENAVDDESIDALISIFSTAMNSISLETDKAKIQQWMDVLQKIKTMEAADHAQEAEELEWMLDNL